MQVIDPVCKMTIEDTEAAATSLFKGATYYFCAEQCKVKFDKNPETYLKKASAERPLAGPFAMIKPKSAAVSKGEPDPVCGMTVDPDSS